MLPLTHHESEELEKLIEAYAFGRDPHPDRDLCHEVDRLVYRDRRKAGDCCDDDEHQCGDAHAPLPDDYGDKDDEFVEVDPSNRYGRYPELLGKGAAKQVYRGFDMDEGIEVAWNQASMSSLEQIHSEVHYLQTLHHNNIIKIYKFWVDTKSGKINFITEICTDNLMNYWRQHRHVGMSAIKDWARQILKALAYLHSQNPPVVHRDLKCANIFLNDHTGQIKLGDFGCATCLDEMNHITNLAGTPEFMAPEMYTQEYNELVDIYAFGGCMIELLTLEIPYEECQNVVQIYKAVTKGVLPKALNKVKDIEAAEFIRRCLAPVSTRPSALELLSDPFLQYQEEPSFFRSPSLPNLYPPEFVDRFLQYQEQSFFRSPSLPNLHPPEFMVGDGWKRATSTLRFVREKELEIIGEWETESSFSMSLTISYPNGFHCSVSKVNFPFDTVADTPESVAEEMVQELNFPVSDSEVIAEMISAVINTLRHKEDMLLEDAKCNIEFGSSCLDYLPAVA